LYVDTFFANIGARFVGCYSLLNKAGTTMRRQLDVGNWKMNGSRHSTRDLLDALVSGWKGNEGAEVVVCPPYPYLAQAAQLLEGSNVGLGAQDVCQYGDGAYTGEVSARMLADVPCQYVIVGHSERRRLFYESDALVAEKFIAAQRAGLTPILCVGESLAQRDNNEALAVIGRQLNAVIHKAGLKAFSHAVVAYEPIWAIGTGRTASPKSAQEAHQFIREQLGELGPSVRILYGGSVKECNAAELFAKPDIDGGLIGGASLDGSEFLAICRAAQ
jgi:triosephosphate isomerase (TIM)